MHPANCLGGLHMFLEDSGKGIGCQKGPLWEAMSVMHARPPRLSFFCLSSSAHTKGLTGGWCSEIVLGKSELNQNEESCRSQTTNRNNVNLHF